MTQRVLITRGAGFIGSNPVNRLVSRRGALAIADGVVVSRTPSMSRMRAGDSPPPVYAAGPGGYE